MTYTFYSDPKYPPREQLAHNHQATIAEIPPQVLRYIQQHHLYQQSN